MISFVSAIVAAAGLVLAASILQDPIVVGLVVGIPTAVLGVLGYRRSVRMDRVSAQAASAVAQGAGVQRVIDGLNTMVDNLQDDNKVLRKTVGQLSRQLAELKTEQRNLKKLLGDLDIKVNGA